MVAARMRHRGFSAGLDERDEAYWRLATVLESSDDAIVFKDLDGVVTSWSKAAECLFGYTAGEIVGKPITLIFPPDRLDEEAAILAQVGRGDRVECYHTVRRHKDGRPVSVSVTISPINDASGMIVGASKIARDLTDREAQARYLTELEKVVSALVHDTHQPLTAIRNYARASRHLLVSGDPDRVASALDRIVEQADRARHIIGRIRDLVQKDEASGRSSSGS